MPELRKTPIFCLALLVLFVGEYSPLPAQLLDYENEGPRERPFVVLAGAQLYRETDTELTNAALYIQSGVALSEGGGFYLGLSLLSGGLADVRVNYLGLNLAYFFGEYPDNGLFTNADCGFAQSNKEFGQLNAPISTGFGAHYALGYSSDVLSFLPPLQLAVTLAFYDLERNYKTAGLQLTFMF